MRIVQLIPGTANTFYCQNCMRDAAVVRAMRRAGHDVTMVPLYLPLLGNNADIIEDSPIFFGGINVYLQQKWRLFRRTPRFVDCWFDDNRLLRWVAGRSGMTDARELGATMLSMLQGQSGYQSKEYHRLMGWLQQHDPPDVVVLSNALLTGFVPSLRENLDAAIVCLLEDEDEFLDELPDDVMHEAQRIIAQHCREVDGLIACSDYYAEVARQRFVAGDDRLSIVPNGIDLSQYAVDEQAPREPVIGYLSRMHRDKGLDLLADAFVVLKRKPDLASLKLCIAGGQTPDDQPFIDQVRSKLTSAGVLADVTFLSNLEAEQRVAFCQSLSVLSVPTRRPEAFGMFILEALACGVPVVQPDHGAFGQIIRQTGGGRLVVPNDVDALASALRDVLTDQTTARQQAIDARYKVEQHFSADTMADRMMHAYARAYDHYQRGA